MMTAHDSDLPLVQITLAKEGEPDKILTLSPQGLRDFLTVSVMEHAHKQPIADAEFDKLARALRTELTEQLRHEIYTTIIGTALMMVRKYYSPRTLLDLLEKLKRDPLQLMADIDDDSFAQYVVNVIREVCAKIRSGRCSIHRAAGANRPAHGAARTLRGHRGRFDRHRRLLGAATVLRNGRHPSVPPE